MAWSTLLFVALPAIAFAQPRIQFATYLGGAGGELARGLATDSAGNIYVAGRTDSLDFPLKDPLQPRGNAFAQIFLAKFAPDGTLLKSTTLGGSDNDEAVAVAVDAAGFIYLTGDLHSTDFQVTNAFQRKSGGAVDAFVMKLDPSFQVVYATYFGGQANDLGYGIVADAAGNAYVCGRTESRDFPVTRGALLTDFGQGSRVRSFVAKFDARGQLAWSTFLGAANANYSNDIAWSIAVDSGGRPIVAGETTSHDFPTVNAIQASPGRTPGFGYISSDGFIAKLTADGSGLIYSTFWGGPASDQALSVAIDSSDNAYVTGATTGGRLPIVGGPQDYLGGDVYFISSDEGRTLQPVKGGLRTLSVLRFAIHPGRPNLILAATFDGIYRSEDGGASWIPSGLDGTPIGRIAFDPDQPERAYAGTGAAGISGAGLYRSDDSGQTWTSMNSGAPPEARTSITECLTANGAPDGGVYFCAGFGGLGFGFPQSLYHVSPDGATWTRVSAGLRTTPFAVLTDSTTGRMFAATATVPSRTTTVAGAVYVLEGDLWRPTTAAGDFRALVQQGGVLYAAGSSLQRSNDGGLSWTPMSPFPGGRIMELVPNPVAPGVLYAQDEMSRRLWKTADGGESWELLNADNAFSTFAVTSGGSGMLLGSTASTDAFVLKLSPAGELLYSTFAGGPENERGESIALGPDGSVAITGIRSKLSYTAAGTTFLSTVGDRVDSVDLGSSVALTILGISSRAVTIDKDGNQIVLSTANEAGLPTPNGTFQTLNGVSDAYLIKIRP